MTANQLWVLIVLGIFHGFHPGMGWLLAVSRGLQERRRSAVVSALPLLALGHAASVALVAVAVTVTGAMTTSTVFSVAGAAILVVAGVWFLLGPLHRGHQHPANLSSWQLAVASFVMACAHGSGLMLLPVLAGQVAHSQCTLATATTAQRWWRQRMRGRRRARATLTCGMRRCWDWRRRECTR